jgi:hypothetical protein
MNIVGCDFHPGWQQVAVLDTETGEVREHKLDNGSGEAERYRQLASLALVGLEASGNSQWFEDLLLRGTRSVDRRCGADPRQLRAQAEDGPARCGAHSEAAAGEPLSAALAARCRAARSAAVADSSSQAGRHSRPGEERIAAPDARPWGADEAQAVEPGRTAGALRTASGRLGGDTICCSR